MKVKSTWLIALLAVFMVQISFAQEKLITGTITDSDGLPLPGATVLVKDTSNGVVTDFDGKYSIKANTGDVLVISYTGIPTIERKVGASNVIDVSMGAAELEEVVVKAYGGVTTVARSNAASTTIHVSDLEERSNASALQNLQGQVSGLNIGTGSGQPGGDSTIILRGIATISGNIEPLFVIDGIPVNEDNFRSLNQNDFATYTVLKDAAATSIYGNRGANGAIVVTTKQGKLNQDLEIRYTTNYGYTELQGSNLELMNTRQRLEFERTNNVGLGNGLTDTEINTISNQVNTFWADHFFRKGTTLSHNLTISSGGERISNLTSLGYFEQEGIFINTGLKRFNVRNNFNGSTKNNKLNYGLNFSLNFSKTNELGGARSGSLYFNPYLQALTGLPYLTPYNPDGSITTDGGIFSGDVDALVANGNRNYPYVLLNSATMNTDREEELKLLAGFNADYKVVKNVTAGVRLGLDFSSEKTFTLRHPESILGPFAIDGSNNPEFGGAQWEFYVRDARINSLFKLNYNNVFSNDHTFDVTAYMEYNKNHYDGLGFEQRGLNEKVLGTSSSLISGNTKEDVDGNPSTPDIQPYVPTLTTFTLEEGLLSFFGTLDYDYRSKYGFGASLRRDASFRFTGDNKWGTFWSVSGRWNINEESFMGNTAFNLLKLRASYGTSGNQRITNAKYSSLNVIRDTYGSGTGYNGTVSIGASSLSNTDIQWEEITTANIGLDFGLWNNKLSGSFDVYKKETDKLFSSRDISLINAPFTSVAANIGAMQNKGAEAYIKYTFYNNENWNISANVNGSYNENKMTELSNGSDVLLFSGNQSFVKGEAIGTYYVSRYSGVNPVNGNPLFLDVNGTLTENLLDANRLVTSGKSQYPIWEGGFGANISYKGFGLSTQWVFVADVYRMNLELASLEDVSNDFDGLNRAPSLLRAWQNPGDITDIPRINSLFNSVDYTNNTDRYLHDASYLRLRNLTFGYTFSSNQLKNLPITGLRFYLQGENLVTFSKWKGYDPEAAYRTSDRGQYPTPKIYTLGASINF